MITVDDDFKRAQGKKNIYIYGAKGIVNIVYDNLIKSQCTVKGFIVSRTVGNPDCIKDLPVHLVYNMLSEKERICIIVAVLPGFRKEVVELLLQLGFCNIITLSDAYALELKRRLDEKQRTNCLNNTDYRLQIPIGIEGGHAVLQKKNSSQSLKWRIDLGMFDYIQQAVGTGAWKDDRLTTEYEQIYGKPEQVLWKAGYALEQTDLNQGIPKDTYNTAVNFSETQSTTIAELVNIYAVKCHVDKPIKKPIPYTYIKEIQAGAALTEQRICDCVDNTGDNISDKNKDFSECSAIYWVWKNGLRKDYTGICHYRRYLDISSEELLCQLEKGITLINTVPCIMYPSNKFFFVSWFLYEYDWLFMMDLIKKLKPEYYETARKFENGHFYLANNIFIMKTEWFDRMCEFVFGILLEIDKYYAERGFERQDRYAGFLFEVLYSIFIMYHAKEMKIAYADMIYTS